MSTRTRFAAAAAFAAAWFCIATLDTAADEGAESDAVDWTAKAKEAWHHTCAKCHTVPDTQYETDRAFLRQITETS